MKLNVGSEGAQHSYHRRQVESYFVGKLQRIRKREQQTRTADRGRRVACDSLMIKVWRVALRVDWMDFFVRFLCECNNDIHYQYRPLPSLEIFH